MITIEDLEKQSASTSELILKYEQAVAAVNYFRERSILVLGWEGVVRFSGGALGHSLAHQGTVDLSAMAPEEAAEFVIETMSGAIKEWRLSPEVEDAELLFCITPAP